MPRKIARPDVDVEELAAELRARWKAADGIMPWLRRRLPRLTSLHEDEGWSWADIGRAMDAAGIRYGTGRPWTGFLLARKVGEARKQVRERQAKRAAAAGPAFPHPAESPAQSFVRGGTRSTVAPVVETEPQIDPQAEPTFTLASLPRGAASSPPRESPAEAEPVFQVARPRAPLAPVSPLSASPSPGPALSSSEVDAKIADLLGRPRLGAVPMPPVPEPEEDE